MRNKTWHVGESGWRKSASQQPRHWLFLWRGERRNWVGHMWLHLKYLLKEGWEPWIAFRIFTSGNSLSLVAQTVKHLPIMRDTRVQSLRWEDLLEKATHSSILAWKIPWTKEAGRLQFMGSQRVGHDWATSLSHSPNNLILFEILNSDQKDVRESKHTAERTHEASGSQ